jgi:inositol phosphorylceramide mannosyltransferase catalytic subunit
MSKIPKIIHQIFYQGETEIPDKYRDYRSSVQENHPHWKHMFWDEKNSRIFLEENYPWFLPVYDSYPYWIQRCDSIRYFILHYYGGFYIDMDIESLKAIDDLLEDYELIFSKLIDINNAIIGSIPGHPLWLQVFEELKKRQLNEDKNQQSPKLNPGDKKSMPYHVAYSTGPILFNYCIVAGKFHEKPTTRLCPGYIFEPGAPMEINGKITKSKVTEESYTIHHMTTRWLPVHHQIMNKIFGFLTNFYWRFS